VAEKTSIEWTHTHHPDGTTTPGATWNPLRGTVGNWTCTRISPGCASCYAEALNVRYGGPRYVVGVDTLRLDDKALLKPLHWGGARKIFVCSMTDIAHEQVTDAQLRQIFGVMAMCPSHTFQVLTKRPQRLADFLTTCTPHGVYGAMEGLAERHPQDQHLRRFSRPTPDVSLWWLWPRPNIWIGTSVESQAYTSRIDVLRTIPAAVRFLSCEPLLGPLVNMNLTGIDWVITGGESGPRRRPADPDWFRDIRDQCQDKGVAYFHKQGNAFRSGQDRLLDGRTWDQFPDGNGTE